MCATPLVLPSPRHRYSEAAHIRAREHGGPDLTENLLYLCPNCHVLFDGGAYVLTDDLTVVDTVADRLLTELERHRWHYIDRNHVRDHRPHWISRNPSPRTPCRQGATQARTGILPHEMAAASGLGAFLQSSHVTFTAARPILPRAVLQARLARAGEVPDGSSPKPTTGQQQHRRKPLRIATHRQDHTLAEPTPTSKNTGEGPACSPS
ncbi:HNH endonuclease [Streptomyces atriruber]|uniref:HNH endonuclease n=1 Tax=Streptomyces atriruber TaxID=545121 RepID=UPI000D150546|nr:HNH endonuclease [Streptomyces atriruber]